MAKAIRSEFTANETLSATAAQAPRMDSHGASAFDRVGRNALAYRPSLYNARTAQIGRAHV